MGAASDALLLEEMGEPIGPLVELAIGESASPGHQRRAVGHGVDDHFEEIGQIELPGSHRISLISRNRPSQRISCNRPSQRISRNRP